MKLKNYSLFHIGIKLDSKVEPGEFKSILKEFATPKGYSVPDKERLDMDKILSSDFNPTREVIVQKEDTRIELNFGTNSINFIGKDPIEVSNLFKGAVDFFGKKGYEIENIFKFFEIVSRSYFDNKNSPQEILNKKTSFNIEKISDMGEVEINSIKIKDKNLEDSKALDITIGTNPLKPSREFIIQIIKRSRDIGEIYKFYRLIEPSIISLLGDKK